MHIEFSHRLALLRKGKTQKEFAKLIGVPLTSYTNWILGISLPKMEHIIKICQVTGVSSDWLLGLSSDNTPARSPPLMPPRGLSAADPHDDAYLDSTTECPRCSAKQDQINKLVDTLHNLSLGRSNPARRSVSAPEKY